MWALTSHGTTTKIGPKISSFSSASPSLTSHTMLIPIWFVSRLISPRLMMVPLVESSSRSIRSTIAVVGSLPYEDDLSSPSGYHSLSRARAAST